MWRPLIARWLAVPLLLVTVAVMGAPARAGIGQYATILFARAQHQSTSGSNCTALPGATTIFDAAGWLKSQGLSATVSVVVQRTAESTRTCAEYTNFLSWSDLARLRDQYGWSALSHTLTSSQLNLANAAPETCGSLPAFDARGHTRAWGMLAYPAVGGDPSQDPTTHDVINACFAFMRQYGVGLTPRANATGPPRTVSTLAVSGGRCANLSRACSKLEVPFSYTPLSGLTRVLTPPQNAYGVVQFYRLVTGAKLTGTVRWDCRSTSWADHWTTESEVFCFKDFKTAGGARSPYVEITDPATVAEAWNVKPSSV